MSTRNAIIAGGTANYSVTVTQTSAQAGNFLVSGTITVTNPNNWEAITFDLSDGNDIGGVCGIAGGGTGITLAAGGSVVKAFNCSFSTVPNLSFINQWTVAVTSAGDETFPSRWSGVRGNKGNGAGKSIRPRANGTTRTKKSCS